MNLINEEYFNGYPVLGKSDALIEDILVANEEVLRQSLSKHNRVTVMRFELKFPLGYEGKTEIISKFFDSLRYRINRDLERKAQRKGRTVSSDLGYVWVKELSRQLGWHYHVAILVNHDVYNCFGRINSENENMYSRILGAWAGAMKPYLDDASGMVHIPKNPIYKLDRASSSFNQDVESVLYRLSYFAKRRTKPYGGETRLRFYGTSKRY